MLRLGVKRLGHSLDLLGRLERALEVDDDLRKVGLVVEDLMRDCFLRSEQMVARHFGEFLGGIRRMVLGRVLEVDS